MKRILYILLILSLLASALSLPGCGNVPQGERTVRDLAGREVPLPAHVGRAVCIGAGALRLYTYVGDLDRLCGVESCEYGYLVSVRPYQAVNAARFAALPSVGGGGVGGTADAEAILALHPDVIFSTYNSDPSAADELQRKTGIPVVLLSYGVTEAFDPAISASLLLIGEVMGTKARAETVVSGIAAIREDLARRSEGGSTARVYLGCQSNYGTHGIGSSTAGYALFDAVGARNVLDEAGYFGYQRALDYETLLTLAPDTVFLDRGGLALFAEEYREMRDVIRAIPAFREGRVYAILPYNAYYTNLEIALADAYYIGKTLMPDAFGDVEIREKFREISLLFLGEDCTEDVMRAVGWFGEIDPEQE